MRHANDSTNMTHDADNMPVSKDHLTHFDGVWCLPADISSLGKLDDDGNSNHCSATADSRYIKLSLQLEVVMLIP